MNILLVRNEFIRKNNYTADYLQLSQALKKLGHKVILIGINNKNKFDNDLVLLKIPFRKRRFFMMELSFFLPMYCILKKIDVVIVSSGIILGTLLLIALRKILSIKIILDIRSIPVEEKFQWDYKYGCRIAQKWYNGATFISTGTKDFIEKSFHLKYKKYAIFTSAVNPFLFSPIHIDNISNEIKQKVKKKIVIFYHGSISPNRGINLILDAVNEIKNTFPNILFLSISERNDYIDDYCKINNYSMANNLLLLNAIKHEQMAAYINLADICIVPLPRIFWWEISSPLKLMEYLAMEKPIILSNISAHQLVVPQNSKFALYFNPDNPTDLGNKILEAINKLDELKGNAYKGREIVLHKYTWDIQAKIVENFISEL
ncbi:MAG: glycosyltransferase [Ignavibacteriaceae bacterium]|nr:glycosyltransferase [Ignavibacteriaceae bacterium]